MSEKKFGYNDVYSLKTPEDSIKLYKKNFSKCIQTSSGQLIYFN